MGKAVSRDARLDGHRPRREEGSAPRSDKDRPVPSSTAGHGDQPSSRAGMLSITLSSSPEVRRAPSRTRSRPRSLKISIGSSRRSEIRSPPRRSKSGWTPSGKPTRGAQREAGDCQAARAIGRRDRQAPRGPPEGATESGRLPSPPRASYTARAAGPDAAGGPPRRPAEEKRESKSR